MSRPRLMMTANRHSPATSPVQLKASATSTGMKVPKVLIPTRLRRISMMKAPTGTSSRILKVCWLSIGKLSSE